VGTWGMGPFDSDSVLGLVDVALREGWGAAVEALAAMDANPADGGFVDYPEFQEAWAGAELVAAAYGFPAPGLPDRARAWVAEQSAPEVWVVALAQRALARLLAEMRAIRRQWHPEFEDEWTPQLHDLGQRLDHARHPG
jgi:Domain of unknown function (DUF4259)